MKMLRCDECEDVFALKLRLRRCACGKSSGRYVYPLVVKVSGPCRVFGVDNSFWFDRHRRGEIFWIAEPNNRIRREK